MNGAGHFKKGQTPWNKGLKGFSPSPETQFKKGQYQGENHPSWQGGIQMPKNDCAYEYAGVGRRVRRPRKIYEQHYGKIPDGYVIIHIDGDKYNDKPENLRAISRAENLNRNNNKK